MIADTPNPPYYAVIFTSARTAGDNGYQEMADLMVRLASEQDGFLGIESAREEIGITVSYWRDLLSIQKWREHVQHRLRLICRASRLSAKRRMCSAIKVSTKGRGAQLRGPCPLPGCCTQATIV